MTTGFGFCPTCGTPRTAAEQKFCPVCGSAFAVGVSPALPVAPVAGPVPPGAPPAWSTPPAGEPTAQAPWTAPPAVSGGEAPPPAPSAPATTSAGTKSRRPLLVVGGLVLVAIVGVFAYMNMSSSTPGSNSNAPLTVGGANLTTFCNDVKGDNTVYKALAAVENAWNFGGSPNGVTASDLSAAAANATRMAGEAPQYGPGLWSKVPIQATMANAAGALTGAAAKMANGDTGGYTEVLVPGDTQGLSLTYSVQITMICAAQ
jgi:hypothetical protein